MAGRSKEGRRGREELLPIFLQPPAPAPSLTLLLRLSMLLVPLTILSRLRVEVLPVLGVGRLSPHSDMASTRTSMEELRLASLLTAEVSASEVSWSLVARADVAPFLTRTLLEGRPPPSDVLASLELERL